MSDNIITLNSELIHTELKDESNSIQISRNYAALRRYRAIRWIIQVKLYICNSEYVSSSLFFRPCIISYSTSYLTIMSYVGTARKHGINAFTAIREALDGNADIIFA